MHHREVTLDDKYELVEGKAYLTGIQALVRLPLDQKRLDLRAGLNTGGFISGYRGSPLGGYDQQLRAAQKWLDQHDIAFWEGLNEDLGATAVWAASNLVSSREHSAMAYSGYGMVKRQASTAPAMSSSMRMLRARLPKAGSSPCSVTTTCVNPRLCPHSLSSRCRTLKFRC